jgi:hypothetical protein
MSTTASAAARFCAGGNKAAGKQCTRQNHHHSSSHDILHLIGGSSAAGPRLASPRLIKMTASVAMDRRCECLIAVSTKFAFKHGSECRDLSL